MELRRNCSNVPPLMDVSLGRWYCTRLLWKSIQAKSGPKYTLVFRPFMIVPGFHLTKSGLKYSLVFRYFRIKQTFIIKRRAFVCSGSVFRTLPRSWQCKASFSLLVVARAITCMNVFKANWRVLTMSGRGLCKCCINLVVTCVRKRAG